MTGFSSTSSFNPYAQLYSIDPRNIIGVCLRAIWKVPQELQEIVCIDVSDLIQANIDYIFTEDRDLIIYEELETLLEIGILQYVFDEKAFYL